MAGRRHYFFCGIGGSGMLPLSLIVSARGDEVSGSDRALDQGRTAAKFDFLRARGFRLFPQDGSGITNGNLIVVTSAAVEETVPDVIAARRAGAIVIRRAELLAELFNASSLPIGVAGTSGKSTTTGMIAWILEAAGRKPTVMNGAIMKNFVNATIPFASAVVGKGDNFVSEIDESDGSIALYAPAIAVLTNVAHDHKSLADLRRLFAEFIGKARRTIVNRDNEEAFQLAGALPSDRLMSFSLKDASADLFGQNLVPSEFGIAFEVREGGGEPVRISLKVPGRHNVANALAALGAARAAGVSLAEAAHALSDFAGIRRRLELVGSANGVTVIDDFAHNPDKIAATLTTLHDFPGRLLVMFQPHGFGPLRLMKDQLIACFADNLRAEDVLIMPEPVYFGGTTDRSVSSIDIVDGVAARGRQAQVFADRAQCGDRLVEIAKAGDRIVVMGARDDTLSQFAVELVDRIRGSK